MTQWCLISYCQVQNNIQAWLVWRATVAVKLTAIMLAGWKHASTCRSTALQDIWLANCKPQVKAV